MKIVTYMGIVITLVSFYLLDMTYISLGYILAIIMFLLFEGEALMKKDALFIMNKINREEKK